MRFSLPSESCAPRFGGGDESEPALLKAVTQDPAIIEYIVECVQELWVTSHWRWVDTGLDGPAVQVPLWKLRAPFRDKK